jgi:hypothetical protein
LSGRRRRFRHPGVRCGRDSGCRGDRESRRKQQFPCHPGEPFRVGSPTRDGANGKPLLNPNCGVRLNESGSPDLVALRSIAAGEETPRRSPSITPCGTIRSSNSRVAVYADRRGSVTGWKDLPDDWKEAYQGFVAPYLLELDENEPVLAHSQHEFSDAAHRRLTPPHDIFDASRRFP